MRADTKADTQPPLTSPLSPRLHKRRYEKQDSPTTLVIQRMACLGREKGGRANCMPYPEPRRTKKVDEQLEDVREKMAKLGRMQTKEERADGVRDKMSRVGQAIRENTERVLGGIVDSLVVVQVVDPKAQQRSRSASETASTRTSGAPSPKASVPTSPRSVSFSKETETNSSSNSTEVGYPVSEFDMCHECEEQDAKELPIRLPNSQAQK